MGVKKKGLTVLSAVLALALALTACARATPSPTPTLTPTPTATPVPKPTPTPITPMTPVVPDARAVAKAIEYARSCGMEGDPVGVKVVYRTLGG